MSKLGEIALGIVTSVGGFLEIGSIATSAQAGAGWGYQLVWVVVLGGMCSVVLIEMSGRFAAASHHTIGAAMRERFGFDYFLIPLLSVGLVSIMVLAAEIGGVCVALELATGVAYPVWAIPVGLVAWVVLWKSSFAFIEKGTSLLGLVTLSFVVAAVLVRPDWTAVARGLVPSVPDHDRTRYWFTAVSILGASITPYLFYFYSSGAIEDEWDASYIPVNRAVATLGMGLGTLIAVAVLVLAGALFAPAGIRVEHYRQLALLLTPVLGWWGFVLTVLSLTFACLGATLEISLAVAYFVAQGLGWQWGKGLAPHEDARFSLCYTIALGLGTLLIAFGIDPIAMTNLSMSLTALTLPVAIGPFLILMNDRAYVGEHGNGALGNAFVMGVIALASIAALVAMPLQLAGSG
jgi:Mn2+/Fe2+ NRAMP family transporter